ncbi:MAG TPA: NAD(P)-binding domain-containing protein [Longimicrobiales bacterium]|nr:NAD(P)-binding domain-containing protein [Longimicrobiales bacterium]
MDDRNRPADPSGQEEQVTSATLREREERAGTRRASPAERVSTVVVGAGQAGLSVGYHLSRMGLPFVILNADERIGDVWRRRWDSLRLFTPARFDGLDGMPFPAPPHSFPTKDEMADYLEAYARRFGLPVRGNARVERLTRENGRYLLEAGGSRLEADNVVLAMSSFQVPHVPAFGRELGADIVQLHSSAYRNPEQLREGAVLVVGAGNSGAEIARETIRTHPTWMAGRDVGEIPFRIEGPLARMLLPFVFRVLFHRVLSMGTPIGRRARAKAVSQGGPLIRVKTADLDRAGVRRVPRMAGVRDGRPLLEDGRVLDVANVIWCTGFRPSHSWIELPVFRDGEPVQQRGVVPSHPDLYFVGLHYLYAMSSTMIHGVGRDAAYVAKHIRARVRAAA